LLLDIYVEFGLFKENTISLTKKGKDGIAQIDAIMKRLRSHTPQTLGKAPVVLIHDYLLSETIDLISDLRYEIRLPKSNVLQFISSDNTVVTVRPSGTEPKIKFYFGLRTTLHNKAEYDAVSASLETRRKLIEEELLASIP